MTIHSFDRGRFIEHFVTVDAMDTDPDSAYEQLAGIMAERGIVPLHEQAFGNLKSGIPEVRTAALAEHGLDPGWPVTLIEGRPSHAGALAGIRLWGISARTGDPPAVRTVSGPGRLWDAGPVRFLVLPAIRGPEPDGSCAPDPVRQAERMFVRAGAMLQAHGFSLRDAVRTWIYAARIDQWYDGLNRARTAAFTAAGAMVPGRPGQIPASTGVEGRMGTAACVMDLLAADGTLTIRRIDATRLQPTATSYGSAFCRATVLGWAGKRTIHVSGTAAIGADGASLAPGDPAGQAAAALRAVEAVLDTQGAGLDDICAATVYLKDAAAYGAWMRVCPAGFPAVPVIADLCRPELLVELEAAAVI